MFQDSASWFLGPSSPEMPMTTTIQLLDVSARWTELLHEMNLGEEAADAYLFRQIVNRMEGQSRVEKLAIPMLFP